MAFLQGSIVLWINGCTNCSNLERVSLRFICMQLLPLRHSWEQVWGSAHYPQKLQESDRGVDGSGISRVLLHKGATRQIDRSWRHLGPVEDEGRHEV